VSAAAHHPQLAWMTTNEISTHTGSGLDLTHRTAPILQQPLAPAVAALPAEAEMNAVSAGVQAFRRVGRVSRYQGPTPQRGPALIDASAAAIIVDSRLALETVKFAWIE
jgi:hypothetical protein